MHYLGRVRVADWTYVEARPYKLCATIRWQGIEMMSNDGRRHEWERRPRPCRPWDGRSLIRCLLRRGTSRSRLRHACCDRKTGHATSMYRYIQKKPRHEYMHTLHKILETVSAPVLTAPSRPADARSIDVSAYLMGARSSTVQGQGYNRPDMRQSIIDRDGWNGTTCHAACTWSHTLDCGHSFLWRLLVYSCTYMRGGACRPYHVVVDTTGKNVYADDGQTLWQRLYIGAIFFSIAFLIL
jgi:hypothetical protein